MKKQFGFSSVIAVMVVSDNSSALRCSFSPVSRDVCGEVVCEFEPPSKIDHNADFPASHDHASHP